MNAIYGYYNGENIIPSSRADLKKNQKVLIKPVKNLGKITDDNYEILLDALSKGEEVEYDYDNPFFSPQNVAAINRAIANLEAGKGTFHELIEVEDDDE